MGVKSWPAAGRDRRPASFFRCTGLGGSPARAGRAGHHEVFRFEKLAGPGETSHSEAAGDVSVRSASIANNTRFLFPHPHRSLRHPHQRRHLCLREPLSTRGVKFLTPVRFLTPGPAEVRCFSHLLSF